MRYVKQFVTEKSPRASVLRWIVLSVTIAATILSLTLPAFAQTKYVITDGDNIIVCMSTSSDPEVVIEEAGLELGAEDTYTTQKSDGVSEICINRIRMITVQTDSDTIVAGVYGSTVRDVLTSLGITFHDRELVSCKPDDTVYDGMIIRLSQYETISYEETIDFKTRVYEDSSLTPGEEVILSEGTSGTMSRTVEIRYENGVEVSRKTVSEKVLTAPVDRVVLCGVDRSVKEQETAVHTDELSSLPPAADGHTNLVPGTNLEYSDVLDFQATAYYCEPNAWNTTYTGTEARVGAIAVDPNFIPLGTKMYIVSADGEYVYGYCTAEDTGGAIKGKIVDLYFNTYNECIQFGRRDVKIYILK